MCVCVCVCVRVCVYWEEHEEETTRAGLNSYHRITFTSEICTASHQTDFNTEVELLTCLTALMRDNVFALICALHERDRWWCGHIIHRGHLLESRPIHLNGCWSAGAGPSGEHRFMNNSRQVSLRCKCDRSMFEISAEDRKMSLLLLSLWKYRWLVYFIYIFTICLQRTHFSRKCFQT